MLVPLLLWSITGFIFLTKPGYEGAYEKLSPTQYDIDKDLNISALTGWQHVQVQRTILGVHLLVNDHGTWRHLDPDTLVERPLPSKQDIVRLIDDATKLNKQRYGSITDVNENVILTSTGVEINLDWSRLRLSQKGSDTRLISTLYKIHYLQWFNAKSLDKAFGFLGLFCLIGLTGLGLASYIKRTKPKESKR